MTSILDETPSPKLYLFDSDDESIINEPPKTKKDPITPLAESTLQSYAAMVSNFFSIVPPLPNETGFLQLIERFFLNPAGYIPFIGSITGIMRIGVALLELLYGFLYDFFYFIVVLLTDALVYFVPAKKEWKIPNEVGFIFMNYTINAIANFLRGFIEFVPFMGLINKYYVDNQSARLGYDFA